MSEASWGAIIAALLPALVDGVREGVAAFRKTHAALITVPQDDGSVAAARAANDAERARRRAAAAKEGTT